jgi:hypothetical protein
MRNIKKSAAVSMMMVALAAGAASAKTIDDTNAGEVLNGTPRPDTISAFGWPALVVWARRPGHAARARASDRAPGAGWRVVRPASCWSSAILSTSAAIRTIFGLILFGAATMRAGVSQPDPKPDEPGSVPRRAVGV